MVVSHAKRLNLVLKDHAATEVRFRSVSSLEAAAAATGMNVTIPVRVESIGMEKHVLNVLVGMIGNHATTARVKRVLLMRVKRLWRFGSGVPAEATARRSTLHHHQHVQVINRIHMVENAMAVNKVRNLKFLSGLPTYARLAMIFNTLSQSKVVR
jgi:uncharacterized membrane protein YbjE (DUF340 family)